jgi:hypothetical protein
LPDVSGSVFGNGYIETAVGGEVQSARVHGSIPTAALQLDAAARSGRRRALKVDHPIALVT